MTESDGIEEALEGIIRTAVMAGSQLGVQLARRRERQLQEHQVGDRHQAKLLADRLEAERRTAQADLAQVYRGEWWNHADPQRIGQTLATATAWASEDPAAAHAEQRIRDEIRARFGVDADTLVAQARAEQAQPRSDQPARAAEPTFSVRTFRNEADLSEGRSKEYALNRIERTPAGTASTHANLEDIRGWIGKDFDVDQAIVEKFPALFSEEQRAVVDAERDRRHRTEEIEASALTVVAAQESATQAPNLRAATDDDRREVGEGAGRLSRDFAGRHRAAQEEAALAGLDAADYLRLVQPRQYRDVAATHLYRERGIEVTPGEQLWADWRMEQALAASDRPLPVVLASRVEAPQRAPYGAELLSVATPEAERANMSTEAYLDHLEVGHHEQLIRASRDPNVATTYDGLPQLSERRVAYALESMAQGRPAARREALEPAQAATPEPSQEPTLGAQKDSRVRYDSTERRGAQAQELLNRGVRSDAVAARLLADTGAARPATDAPIEAQRRAPQARLSRSAGRSGDLTRPGVER